MEETTQLAEKLKALSDPTRLRILTLLGHHGTADCSSSHCGGQGFLCVNALAHILGVSQSAVSQHLRVLRQAGLVHGAREGSFVHYSVDAEALAALHDDLGGLIPGRE